MTKRIAILGGGITGLASAFYLEKRLASTDGQTQIELFEAGNRLGGKIHTVRENGFTLEMGAESFLVRKRWAIELCKELGIEDKLQSTIRENRKTFIWSDSKFHRLPEGLSGIVPARLNSLLSSSLLSWHGKLRVFADLLLPARRGSDDEPIGSFISRRLGKQAYEKMVEPLLCGIYAADGYQLSLQSTFPQLRDLERSHGSLIRGLRSKKKGPSLSEIDNALPDFASPFATFKTGMSFLVESLAKSLKQTRMHLNKKANQIKYDGSKWFIVGDDIETAQCFDDVIVTLPSFAAARLFADRHKELANLLMEIPHASTALANCWFRSDRLDHPLDGYGFVIPSVDQRWMTATTWISSKHTHRTPEAYKLLRVYLGKAGNEIKASVTDDQLIAIAKQELNRTMGISVEPDGVKLQRWPNGSPQYNMNHPSILKKIDMELTQYQRIARLWSVVSRSWIARLYSPSKRGG